ncbi:hypothetical protein CFOL_v3_04634 [Cephalotus follicularis]|uniref:Putative plant transposon protein domain-containing protein n=1 Tax=Cephalotus follicularis TaxID=3775 RepID=A0A1Q3AZB1_CEPFO|nr:hypothetical protein CFOL_v3_04634 [Cephalotus follicularis]
MVELSTKVRNKEIELDVETLATILNVPDDGAGGWNQRTWVTNLSLHYRFLHRAVCTHILPKAGGFDEVTHMEAYTMYHLIIGKRINVPFLIINHMHAIHDRENVRLGYSNIITKILHFFAIDLTGEINHPLQSVDKLGKGTLGRMGSKSTNGLEPGSQEKRTQIESLKKRERQKWVMKHKMNQENLKLLKLRI